MALVILAAGAVGTAIGSLIGYFASGSSKKENDRNTGVINNEIRVEQPTGGNKLHVEIIVYVVAAVLILMCIVKVYTHVHYVYLKRTLKRKLLAAQH